MAGRLRIAERDRTWWDWRLLMRLAGMVRVGHVCGYVYDGGVGGHV